MVLSRDRGADALRCEVHGENLNIWCQIPGNPFAGSLVLLPNPVALPPPAVTYGPIDLPDRADTFTLLVRCPGALRHEHTLALETQVLDSDRHVIAESTARLGSGDHAAMTLGFAPPPNRKAAIRLKASFEHYAGGTTYGSIRLPYLLVYENNPLVELSNRAGTDKGTELSVGRGAPHCYAIDYHRLFAPFRDDEFRMLEIGLETASAHTGKPTDAPSLRVWHEYFPHARIYGYDINDFSFFERERIVTYRGDQSSREDLERFLAEHDQPRFRVVIDDGSHASSHQQISLAVLFRRVEPGGIYIVEDLHWQPFAETPKTLDVLRRSMDGAGIESPFIGEDDARYLEQTIESIAILKPNDAEIGVIRKQGS